VIKQVFATALVMAALVLAFLAAPPRAAIAADEPTLERVKQLEHSLDVADKRADFFRTLSEEQRAAAAAAESLSRFKSSHDELAKALGCAGAALVIDTKINQPICPPKPDPAEAAARDKIREQDQAVQEASRQASAALEAEQAKNPGRVSPPATEAAKK